MIASASIKDDSLRIDAPTVVEALVDRAVRELASDLHLEPTSDGFDIRLRIDGMLETVDQLDAVSGRAVVTRFMVLAHLLTYRMDVPQEGRASVGSASTGKDVELRISIIPTVHGLRCAIRLPAELTQPRDLDSLGLGATALNGIRSFISSGSGLLLIIGPAGSGKTTTLYAILEEIRRFRSGTSIVTLEDPVERHLSGITQIQVQPFGQLTYEKCLRSILRQDPQVLMLGEIRDAATASLAVQAALSGHQLLCTLHAPQCSTAVARLLEMGLESYQISSSLFGVLSMRLVRRLNKNSGQPKYCRRVPVAEWVEMDDELRRLIVQRADAGQIRAAYARRPGYQSLLESAQALVKDEVTDQAEIERAGLVPSPVVPI